MKRWFVMLLSVLLAFSLSGCMVSESMLDDVFDLLEDMTEGSTKHNAIAKEEVGSKPFEKSEEAKTETGIQTWKDGTVTYTGQKVNGKIHGYGKQEFASGEVYEGDFENGIREGNGTYTWPGKGKYVGDFHNDKMDGQGTYTWADGSKYTGGWKADKRHGTGVYTSVSGTRTNQQWNNGELITNENSNKEESSRAAVDNNSSNNRNDDDFFDREESSKRTIRCSKCGGDGKMSCSRCSGDGGKYVYDSVPNYSGSTGGSKTVRTWENCSKCHGSGEQTCTRCGGDGEQ